MPSDPPPRSEPLVVLGVDPGLTVTGWGVVAIDGDDSEVLDNAGALTLAIDPANVHVFDSDSGLRLP